MKKKICRKIMAVALTGLVFAVSILPGFASSGFSDAGNPEMSVITASAVGGNGGQTAGGEVGGSAAIDSPANGIDGDTNSMIPGAGDTIPGGNGMTAGDESAGNAAAEEDKLNSNPDAGNNLTNGGDNAANDTDMTGEMEENANDMTKSTNWAAIIIAIVIAVALVAVIVALIPKKRSDS